MLELVPIGGLQAFDTDELIPLSEALDATDCITEDNAIRGRSGSRLALASAIAGSGNPQGLIRFRPSRSAARSVALLDGKVYVVTDPTSETASDGSAALVGAPFGASAELSMAQLGRYLYIATDEANVAWRRLSSDFTTLESLDSLPQPAKPTGSKSSAPAFVSYRTAGYANAVAGGAGVQTGIGQLPADWHAITNGAGGECPVDGMVTYTLPNDSGQTGQDWRGYGWVIFGCTPRDVDYNCAVEILIAPDSSGSPGAFTAVGTITDTPRIKGSNNCIFCPLDGVTAATRQAVKYVRFRMSGPTTGKFGALGHCLLPASPVGSPIKYYVRLYNPATGQASPLSEEVEVQVLDGDGKVGTYTNCYIGSGSTFYSTGAQDDPMSASNNRVYNRQAGKAMPAQGDIGSIITISGNTPTGYSGTATVELFKDTETGRRKVTEQTGLAAGAAYSLVDKLGAASLSNVKWKATGAPTQATALAARGGRLVAVYRNRVAISGYIAPDKASDPYPQFPPIALEAADGWAYDFCLTDAEIGLGVINGDALYLLTSEAVYALANLSAPLTDAPPPVFLVDTHGVIGRRAYCYAEGLLLWAAVDGVRASADRTEAVELSLMIQRTYRDWFLPDSTTEMEYREKWLYLRCQTRGLAYSFRRKRWYKQTFQYTALHAARWRDPTGKRQQLWLYTSDRKLTRVQEGLSRDLQSGTDETTGAAIPSWTYSTGFEIAGVSRTIEKIAVDATGPVSVMTLREADDDSFRRVEFEGLYKTEEKPAAPDLRSYGWRLELAGANSVAVRKLLWELEPIDAQGE